MTRPRRLLAVVSLCGAASCLYSFQNPVDQLHEGSVAGTVQIVNPAPGQTLAGGTVTALWTGLTIPLPATGSFAFFDLPDGLYALSYGAPGTGDGGPLLGFRPDITLPNIPGGTDAGDADSLELGTLPLMGAGVVQGTVQDPSGAGVPGAVVAAFEVGADGALGAYEGFSTVAGPGGNYALALPAGSQLLAASDATRSVVLPATVASNATLPLPLPIAPVAIAASISGDLVLGEFGASASPATVDALLPQVQVAVDGGTAASLFSSGDQAQGVGALFSLPVPAGELVTMVLTLPGTSAPSPSDLLPPLPLPPLPAIAGQTTFLGPVPWLTVGQLAANLDLDAGGVPGTTSAAGTTGGATTSAGTSTSSSGTTATTATTATTGSGGMTSGTTGFTFGTNNGAVSGGAGTTSGVIVTGGTSGSSGGGWQLLASDPWAAAVGAQSGSVAMTPINGGLAVFLSEGLTTQATMESDGGFGPLETVAINDGGFGEEVVATTTDVAGLPLALVTIGESGLGVAAPLVTAVGWVVSPLVDDGGAAVDNGIAGALFAGDPQGLLSADAYVVYPDPASGALELAAFSGPGGTLVTNLAFPTSFTPSGLEAVPCVLPGGDPALCALSGFGSGVTTFAMAIDLATGTALQGTTILPSGTGTIGSVTLHEIGDGGFLFTWFSELADGGVAVDWLTGVPVSAFSCTPSCPVLPAPSSITAPNVADYIPPLPLDRHGAPIAIYDEQSGPPGALDLNTLASLSALPAGMYLTPSNAGFEGFVDATGHPVLALGLNGEVAIYSYQP